MMYPNHHSKYNYRTILYTTILALILSRSTLLVQCEEGELGPLEVENRCAFDCGDNGECKGTDTYINGCNPEEDTNKCEVYKCACDYGFTGDDCSLQYETCEDHITTSPDETARQCFNGGKCEAYLIMDPPEVRGERGIRCNCQSLPTDTIAYAGHQCEFPAEHVCIRNVVHSTYAFCVNNGTCKELVDDNEEHPLCDCLPGYGGRHCQFKVNTDSSGFELNPIDEIEYVNLILHGKYGNETKILQPTSSTNDERSGGMKFLIILIVFLLCSITCCIYLRRQRKMTTTKNGTFGSSSSAVANHNNNIDDDDAAWDSRDEDIHTTNPTKNELI